MKLFLSESLFIFNLGTEIKFKKSEESGKKWVELKTGV